MVISPSSWTRGFILRQLCRFQARNLLQFATYTRSIANGRRETVLQIHPNDVRVILTLCVNQNIRWNMDVESTNAAHYVDIIMGTIASQITSLTIVYSTVYSDADQRKHQISASLAFVWGIHRRPVNSLHKWRVTRKMLPFDDVIM